MLNHRRIRPVFTEKLCRSSCTVSVLCQILTTSEFVRWMLVGQEVPYIKFQENMATGSRGVLCGQIDMTNVTVTFRNCFVKAPIDGEMKAIER